MQYRPLSRLLFHPANGGKRNAKEAAKFKRMGVRAGVSDLLLLMPRKGLHGLCIELKVGKNKQTESQRAFQSVVEGQGYKYAVCRSVNEFITIINEYLSDE